MGSILAPAANLVRFAADLHNRTVLFRVGNWIFTTYGVFTAAAYTVAIAIALWFDAATGQSVGAKLQLYALIVLPAVLVGCRAFSVLLEWRELFRRPVSTLIKPGYMYHGGVFGGAVALYLFAEAFGSSTLLTLDALALALPMGEAICRLGCMVYGCCWGRPTGGPLGIRYTSPDSKVVRCRPELRGVAIHPVQLYAAIAHVGLFAVIASLVPTRPFDGALIAAYLILHPLLRLVLEWFRSDDRGTLGRVSHTQIYTGLMFVAGWALVGVAPDTLTPFRHVGVRAVLQAPHVLQGLALVAVVCCAAYGVHYRRVGAWIASARKPAPRAAEKADA